MNGWQHIAVWLLRGYRAAVSPLLTALFGPMGFGCRFAPTCSEYALEAVRRHGAWRGGWLAGRRLCRCHPWGEWGVDEVPGKVSSFKFQVSSPPAVQPTVDVTHQGGGRAMVN